MTQAQPIIFQTTISKIFQTHQLTIKRHILSTNRDKILLFSRQIYPKPEKHVIVLFTTFFVSVKERGNVSLLGNSYLGFSEPPIYS